MSIPILAARGEFTGYIRTGGKWVTDEKPEDHTCGWGRNRCDDHDHGHYAGGTREPGRFTSKLAPASADPLANALRRDRLAFPEHPAPRYDTPAEVTKRCHEAGTGTYLPVRGEEAAVKFVKALRALSSDWERDVLTQWRQPIRRAA